MHLFYTPDIQHKIHLLNEEESKHCMRVLRLYEGDSILLTDGQGSLYEALLKIANPKACSFEITKRIQEYGKREFKLSIAIAPTKNTDRFEWFLEKVTEIGIDEIIPLICKYSERKDIKPERLEKVIISAMKQSQKAYLPDLLTIQKFKEFINKPFDGNKFIAHCINNEKNRLKNLIRQGGNVLILIGPEGDFSPEEIQMALSAGFTPVSLGDSRLRTETAGVVACHTVNLINQK